MGEILKARPRGGGRFEVTVEYPDFLGLLSAATGVFAVHGLGITGGHIRTVNARAVDVFQVTAAKKPDWARVEEDLSYFFGKMRGGEAQAARLELNGRIVRFLRTHAEAWSDRLYPIDLRVDQESSPTETVVDIRGQDTPAFLYEVTNALSLLGINIVRMEIETAQGTARDRLWVTSDNGQKITSRPRLRALQWAVLLVKHFTHLLPRVPDPAAALDQMVLFGRHVFERDDFDTILLTLKKSRALRGLGRMLGSSLFLWEEFIRLQHDPIFKIIGQERLLRGRKTKSAMGRELRRRLARISGFDRKADALNEFKDRELFRIDLRHLLGKTSYLQEFAEEFTDLAEVVVAAARDLTLGEMRRAFPPAEFAAARKCRDAVFALGKFGGRELGYASDLEILFITGDPGDSSARSQANLRFYGEFVSRFVSVIRARTEGVFEIDLRLRPYGKAGPNAVSLGLFKSYYSVSGKARNFERQALIKLRQVAGDPKLGRDVLALRDAFVYGPAPFDFKEAAELRERQRAELVQKGTMNAKYSAGGLLDIEYAVQTLQIVYGRLRREVRQTNTIRAIDAVRGSGVIPKETTAALADAYIFLRDLINALRIFRGNARDLAIPAPASTEFVVLGRRMGYEGDDERVRKDFHARLERSMTGAARLYSELMAGLEREESKVNPQTAVTAGGYAFLDADDLVREGLTDRNAASLAALGFAHPALAIKRFAKCRELMNACWPLWSRTADPDLAIDHLERFGEALGDPRPVWEELCASQKKLAVLLTLFGQSRYLSEVLIHHPEYWAWMREEKNRTLGASSAALSRASRAPFAIAPLRRLRHRECLRIALAETFGAPLEGVFSAVSALADFVIGRVFDLALKHRDFCVIGLGKLGGSELNYSSDVDLMFLRGKNSDNLGLIRDVRYFLKLLHDGPPDEMLYRVDLRLRPHGAHGALFLSAPETEHYYEKSADFWEYQALIKARPVAGNKGPAEVLLRRLRPLVYRRRWPARGIARLREIKRRYEETVTSRGETDSNVKLGSGGIRDIEFTVQFLQLTRGSRFRSVTAPNMFRALDECERHRLLSENQCHILRDGYAFQRRVENRIQLYENRQHFNVPHAAAKLRALARSMGFFDTAGGRAEDRFRAELAETRRSCRAVFEKVFYGRRSPGAMWKAAAPLPRHASRRRGHRRRGQAVGPPAVDLF